MTTHTVTSHPVRSDVPAPGPHDAPAGGRSTRWALAGLASGIAGAGAIISSLMVSAIYDEDLKGDTAGQAEKLADEIPQLVTFHTLAGISAVLMVVFAAGLYRRLRSTAPESVAPMVAFSGLFGTAIILMLGAGLDTEFMFGLDQGVTDPANAVFYAHWIATIPWVWGLVGLSGLAVFAVARAGGVPRWLGLVGLLGGGLTLLLGISPLQYMAGFTGPIGVIVVALGFLLGDKAFRSGS
ncbi:MAG TPA: hypothetical protein VD859_11250 [Nocardioides sp.]|nr:hypothetical protein [Nocardioides sp.]